MQNLFSRSRPSTQPLISAEDLDLILNSFDKAAMLVDKNSLKIISANPRLLELTAYTRSEIDSMEIGQILNGDINGLMAMRSLPKESTLPRMELLTRNKKGIQVAVRIQTLSEKTPWAFVTFEDVDHRNSKKANDTRIADLLNHHLLGLAAATQTSDPEKALEQILEIGRKLLPESTLSIYIGRGKKPSVRQITKLGEEAGVFPNEISLPEINHLIQPSIWKRGERAIVTSLHQAARSAGFLYLASSPIGEGGNHSEQKAWLGMILAGGKSHPPDNTRQILNILAGFAAVIIYNNVIVTNLRRQITTTNVNLSTWDTVRANTKDGVITVSPEFQIQSLNPSAEIILGYASSEIQNHPINNIIIGTDRLMPALRSALDGEPNLSLGNIYLHRRDGSSFPADLEINPIINNGSIIGGLVFIRDLSENEQIRLKSQQLEQRALLGEVTSVFAHEVRNPINNINMGLQLLERDLPEDNPERVRIQNMQDDCQRLTALMDSVLTFSRTGNYVFVPINVDQLLQKILKRWRPRFKNVNVKSHIRSLDDLPAILGDQRSLEQVFTNIISNAVSAMQDTGGTFAVNLSKGKYPSGKPNIQIKLSDTGTGIPEENHEKIFEPFFTTNPNGTGLGLSITKQIITAHKGNISLTSFPGGTTFQIQIPSVEVPETNKK